MEDPAVRRSVFCEVRVPTPPGPFPQPQLDFAKRLRELRLRAGQPTEESLARQMGCGRTTVSDILNGRRFPNWELLSNLVRACGSSPGQWKGLWEETHLLLDEIRRTRRAVSAPSGGALLPVVWYRSNPEFYRAVAREVRGARSEIRVTYIRRHPPTHYISAASAEYFAAILDWARAAVDEDSERTVRRIIGVPEIAGTPDPVMLDWVRDHHAETAGLLNYEVTILRWSTGADGQNMALIDDSTAFLAFSGGFRQKLNGSSVKDPTFLSYYAAYFDQLWHGLVPIQTYLDQVGG